MDVFQFVINKLKATRQTIVDPVSRFCINRLKIKFLGRRKKKIISQKLIVYLTYSHYSQKYTFYQVGGGGGENLL